VFALAELLEEGGNVVYYESIKRELKIKSIYEYYESIKRELKIKSIYECRCDERLHTKTRKLRASYTLG
jgi:hypothetical protein